MAVPDLRADGELLNERHRLFFVDYLRLYFRFGRFPGYEGIDRGIPAEIATLSEELLHLNRPYSDMQSSSVRTSGLFAVLANGTIR